MTTTLDPARATTGAPRLGALVRSEALRARSRRSLLWLSVIGIAGVLAAAALMWFTTAHVDQSDIDAAGASFLAEQQQYYEQCLADPSIPESDKAMYCYKPTDEDMRANALWNLSRRPFGQDSFSGLVSLAGGVGLLFGLLLAATTGGADWGARTMGLVLSWEPRRTRLFAVRLGVVALIGLVLQIVLVGIAVASGWLIAKVHYLEPAAAASLGDSFQPADLGAVVELAARWLPLAVVAAIGSFAVAMLTRSTGWAVGALIGFVSVVESLVQGLWPWGSQWLIQTNIAAWLQGGITHVVDPAALQGSGFVPEGRSTPGTIWISDTRALATLCVGVVAAVLISWLSFRARDVE